MDFLDLLQHERYMMESPFTEIEVKLIQL